MYTKYVVKPADQASITNVTSQWKSLVVKRREIRKEVSRVRRPTSQPVSQTLSQSVRQSVCLSVRLLRIQTQPTPLAPPPPLHAFYVCVLHVLYYTPLRRLWYSSLCRLGSEAHEAHYT
eukprot:9494650-Pyramimonas_sp.AAC.3